MITQGKSRKKYTGGILRKNRKKKKYEMGRERLGLTLGEEKKKKIKTRGSNQKTRLVSSKIANVTDPKTGKTFETEIKNVSKNPANPHYVRRNIITKGAIIETEKGKAKVTSRPSQDGTINAVLVK